MFSQSRRGQRHSGTRRLKRSVSKLESQTSRPLFFAAEGLTSHFKQAGVFFVFFYYFDCAALMKR